MGATTCGTISLRVGNFGDTWITHVNYKAQNIDDGWTRLILEKSDGFTRAVIKRMNDSIRTYIYCILGAQVKTRTSITGQSGSSLEAQKQFNYNFEVALNANLSIPYSIKRYQMQLIILILN